jgi:peptidoglycan/LPS O-acetylase OafA/YrhL
MEISERLKEDMRKELLRRKTFETEAITRKSFLKAAGAGLICLLSVGLLSWQFATSSDLTTRGSDVFLFCFALAGGALAAVLAYVRFSDWRWKLASEKHGSSQR